LGRKELEKNCTHKRQERQQAEVHVRQERQQAEAHKARKKKKTCKHDDVSERRKDRMHQRTQNLGDCIAKLKIENRKLAQELLVAEQSDVAPRKKGID
jgi:hypothetical protein